MRSISVILAFPTFLPVNFQSAWASDITWRRRRGEGVPLPSAFFFPFSLKPTHIWKWEEGNPRWWLKCSLLLWETLHICFPLRACRLRGHQCEHPHPKSGAFALDEVKMIMCFYQKPEIKAPRIQKEWHLSDVVLLFIVGFSWQQHQMKMSLFSLKGIVQILIKCAFV